MSVTVRVDGVDQFGAVARRLKDAGARDLRRELYRGLNRAVKPMKEAVRSSVGDYMPSGYTPILEANLKLGSSNRAGGRNPGIRITGRAKGRPRPRRVGALEAGVLRHPLFGNRGYWYATSVRPGFFGEPLKRDAPEARVQIKLVLDELAEKIAHGGL